MNTKFLAKSNQRGIAMIEYALLLMVVAVGIYAALDWDSLATKLQAIITSVVTALTPS